MFDNLAPLPLTVTASPGECATSFASRLARRNGVPRLITFCSDIGIDYFQLVNGDPAEIHRLAALGGADADQLQQGTARLTEPGWFRLGRERLKFTALARSIMRVCPICIAEAASPLAIAQQGEWQLASIRTCKVHGCYLMPLPKLRSGNDRFDLMQALDLYEPIKPERANPDQLVLENYLRKRIRHGPGSSWLDRLPFHVASQLCEGFGLLLTQGPKARRDRVGPAEWLAAGTVGFAVLRHGPDAFRASLKEVQMAQPIDHTLYRTRYRVFFDWLRDRDDDPDFDKIRDIMRDFIFRNFPVAEGDVVLGQPCPEQYVHSLATARSRYGISGWQLGRRLAAMGMARRNSPSKQFILEHYIPTDVVENIVAEVAALLNATDAAQYLGIDRIMMGRFTTHGLIRKYDDTFNTSPLYQPQELDRFLNNLRALAKTRKGHGQYLDIAAAARRLRMPMARLTGIILDQHLPLQAEASAKASFPDLRISLAVLQQALAAAPDGVMKPSEAAKRLQVNIRTIRGLLDIGILKPQMVKDRKTGRRRRHVRARSVERFADDYITVTDLAEKSGRLPSVEAVLQIDRGAKPLPLDKRCNTIFRRRDL